VEEDEGEEDGAGEEAVEWGAAWRDDYDAGRLRLLTVQDHELDATMMDT
jgi:hypothetical protein